jgi:hypothetical protein
MTTLRPTLIAGAALAALAAAPAHAAPTEVAVEQRPFSVSAHGDTIAWSSHDAATDAYRLVVRTGDGAPRVLPVAPSGKPFDVDLGTNAAGSLYAVYSRCDDDDCDLYRLAVASGREQRLRTLSAPDAVERDPSIHRGHVIFVREERGRGGRRLTVLRSGNTARGGTPTRALVRLDRRDGVLSDPQLDAGHMAYVVTVSAGEGGLRTIRLRNRRSGRDVAIYRARSGALNLAAVTRPSFGANGAELYWARTNAGSGRGNRYVMHHISSGFQRFAVADPAAVSTAWLGEQRGMAVATAFARTACKENDTDPDEDSRCRLSSTGPLSFDAGP